MLVAIASLLIAGVLFCLIPAWMLGVEYNVAVGVAYFCLSVTALSTNHAIHEIRSRLARLEGRASDRH